LPELDSWGFGIKLKVKIRKTIVAVLVSGASILYLYKHLRRIVSNALFPPNYWPLPIMVVFTVFTVVLLKSIIGRSLPYRLVGAYAIPFCVSEGSGSEGSF